MTLETKNILYLPGLGDQNTTERQRKYLSWKLKKSGITLTFFDPKWSSDESYDKKWDRLQDLLNTCNLKQTTAVGVSAGGSLLMRILADYPDLLNAHSVCGKLQNSIG
ncbi:MAG: alpha/beta hydrolase, partial [Candidatus Saccharibacteria bacterium]|nr:alpha/beta hydrolase [Candidatus Saccharibacteria bacterium]